MITDSMLGTMQIIVCIVIGITSSVSFQLGRSVRPGSKLEKIVVIPVTLACVTLMYVLLYIFL